MDSFTHRHPLADAGDFLDQVVNVWMEEAVIQANEPGILDALREKPGGCDEERLMKSLEDRLAGYLVGQLESFADQSTYLDTIATPFEESIYRDFDFVESPTTWLTRRLAVLLRIGEVYLGADKLGHFFTEGHSYYEKYTEELHDTANTLRYGERTESSYYGELTTGIYSFADLAANLNGLRFWNNVLGKHPDPLHGGRPERPYIGCVDGKWRRLRPFQWKEYVDPAWDEAINCNAYRDASLLKKITRRILEATGGRACPLQPAEPIRRRLQAKYGLLLSHVFNDQGPRALGSFERLLDDLWNAMELQYFPQPAPARADRP